MTVRLKAGAFFTVLTVAISFASISAAEQARKPATAAKPAGPAGKSAPTQHTGLNTEIVSRPWTGDFDGMLKRRLIRILTPYSKTTYFIDKGVQRGTSYEAGVKFEDEINKKYKTTIANKVHVVFIPTSRDALADALFQGRGDIVLGGITVSPERAKVADFSIPTIQNVAEIAVTGLGAPTINTVDDLSGQTVAVREKSIQFESLHKLNDAFKQQGKAPVAIRTVPTNLEDEDLLEMCNAGLLKIVIVDDIYARFWDQILTSITPHPTVKVRDDGDYAWVARKGSPKLVAEMNAFIKKNGAGTAFGNVLLQKYLKNTKFVKSATSDAEIKRFKDLIDIFRKYGGQYKVDYLLMMAQGFQESRLDQSVKSHVGAVGVMQVMPATGKDMNVGDITKIDPNVNAGVKYIRFMIDQYFKDEPMDDLNKGLFAFASYNAGPARIRSLRKLAAQRSLNPNVWFNNVERVVAEKIGRETTNYVSNIYKYYVAYTLTMQEMQEKQSTKGAVAGQ
jgi:membrane-bound lytic murein transglycosylase MltF